MLLFIQNSSRIQRVLQLRGHLYDTVQVRGCKFVAARNHFQIKTNTGYEHLNCNILQQAMVGKMAQDVEMVQKCCSVVATLFGCYLGIPSLHVLVFIIVKCKLVTTGHTLLHSPTWLFLVQVQINKPPCPQALSLELVRF